ncbi:MAG: diguanylate cyclase [Candidatus Competibacteraceae bacterium]|jgi:diguanylate cyclase (GGDEF)-like protein
MNANTRRILAYLIGLSLIITTAVVASLAYNLHANNTHHEQLALETGRIFFKEQVIIRRWNASLGGIYAPVTDTLQPNPYLDDPHRDLTTTNGLKLTKINPAFMTRLLSEMSEHTSEGINFHITSLKPLNPHNAPDEWERRALENFARGADEQFEVVEEPRGRILRFMGRLIAEKPCLKCHAHQGYQVGEVRGGIRVSLPLASFEIAAMHAQKNIYWMHGLFWLTTLTLLWSFGVLLLRNVAQLEKLNGDMKSLNQQLESAALTDSLTGIPNRLYFDQQIEANILTAQRYGITFSIVMLDLDHFKQVNDQYGHTAGDRVLQEFSKITKSQIRQTDQLARWGGEEFIIALPHTGPDQALTLAERVREAVAAHDFSVAGSLTTSIGVAGYRLNETPIALLERVDGALYRAKTEGRNRVERAA